MAVTWKKLAYEDDVITKALLTTKGDMIYASAAGTPARLGIGSDDQILRVNVDVPNWENVPPPAAHALDSHQVPTGAVDFDLQVATDLVIMNVANQAALPVVGIAVGQPCFALGELSLHVCTAIA